MPGGRFIKVVCVYDGKNEYSPARSSSITDSSDGIRHSMPLGCPRSRHPSLRPWTGDPSLEMHQRHAFSPVLSPPTSFTRIARDFGRLWVQSAGGVGRSCDPDPHNVCEFEEAAMSHADLEGQGRVL